MATLTFGVSGEDQNWTTDIELSEVDSLRTMAYLMSPTSGYGTVTDAKGTRLATPEEAAQNFANATLATLLNQTVSWEKSEAAAAAAAKVEPIVPVAT